MAFNSLGDLRCGQDQAAGRMEDKVDGSIFISEAYGSEDRLGILDINVADQRNPEHIDAFLTVNQHNHSATSLFLQGTDRVVSQFFNAPALHDRHNDEKSEQHGYQTLD